MDVFGLPQDPKVIHMAGARFSCVGIGRAPSAPDDYALRKTDALAERYLQLADDFQDAQILELGIDEGASTAFLALLMKPRKLVAVDIGSHRVAELDSFVQRRDLGSSVRPYWGVDQGDRDKLQAILAREFGDVPLDLVIDDASHALAPTRTSFELLYPRLRPGGVFLIEDWSTQLWFEHGYLQGDAGDGEEGDALAEVHRQLGEPLARLVCEIVAVTGYRPDVIAGIRIWDGWLEIERGPAELSDNFSVSDLLHPLGQRMFR